MTAAPLPPDEPARLSALHALEVLDSAPEPEFDALVQAAALVCGVPISLISLIDADRQWFKANIGLPGVTQTPREQAFCAHAILQEGIFEVPDAMLDERFAGNALVTGDPGIRFYAGAPLRLSDGARAGTLCVIDRQPRQLSPMQREVLTHLATAAVRTLEGRRALQAERLLGATTSQAAAVLRNSVDAILTLALDGRITYWNTAAERLFGRPAEAMLGQSVDMLLPGGPGQDKDDFQARLAASAAGVSYEAVRMHRNGEPVAVSISLAPITDARGVLVGATKILRDIREPLRAAQVLADSEARFRALSESSPLGVFASDAQARCTYVNARWQAIYGLTEAQGLGTGWATVLHPDDRAAVFTRWMETAVQGREFDMEFPIQRTDGQQRIVRSRARAHRGSDGVLKGFVGSVEDVTAQRTTSRQLAASEQRLRRLYLSTPGMLHSIDAQGRLLTVSDHWLSTLGYAQDEVIGRLFSDFLTEDSRGTARQALQDFLNSGRCDDVPHRMLRRNGEVIDVLLSSILERDAAGQPLRSMTVLRDVTDQLRAERALQDEHARLTALIDGTGAGTWEWNVETGVMKVNERWAAIMGWTLAALGPVDVQFRTDIAHPDEVATTRRLLRDHFNGLTDSYVAEVRLRNPAGEWVWVEDRGRLVSRTADGRPEWVFGICIDISERKAQEEALRKLALQLAQQHELMRVTLRSIGDAVITTDAAGIVTWLNPVAERMTGWLNNEARGRPVAQVFHIVHEQTRALALNPVMTCLSNGEVAGLPEQTLLISRDGQEFGIEDSAAPIRSDSGEMLGVVLVFHDVTEQRRLSGEMSYRATHDALTGLVNRSEFETRLRRVLHKAQEDGSGHALLFIDLDQFKLVNDACGHSVGDQLLQQVAKLLTEAVRARDTVARLGGDEFAVILEHCDSDQAQRVAQQICERMDHFRFIHDGRRFRIGASVGQVPVDSRWANTAAIVQAADSACYAAKEAGRNRVHAWFDTDLAMRTRHGEAQWAARLEQALDEDRFAMYAQRIQPLGTVGGLGSPPGVHAELLLRLIESDGSVVLPGAFLPAAERFHLAWRIDRWVLRHAIDLLRALPDLSGIDTLCVNLSGQSIGDRAFHRQAIEALRTAGAAVCSRLCLEITETSAVTHMADAGVFTEQVRALGVRIALDDFGAGASSFGYLKHLSVDTIKIDGQYIRDLLDDPLDDAAVRCFVDVARVVGVKTVAEFVDRPELLARVREIGIHYAQGYLLHRPEPVAVVLGLAAQAKT